MVQGGHRDTWCDHCIKPRTDSAKEEDHIRRTFRRAALLISARLLWPLLLASYKTFILSLISYGSVCNLWAAALQLVLLEATCWLQWEFSMSFWQHLGLAMRRLKT